MQTTLWLRPEVGKGWVEEDKGVLGTPVIVGTIKKKELNEERWKGKRCMEGRNDFVK